MRLKQQRPLWPHVLVRRQLFRHYRSLCMQRCFESQRRCLHTVMEGFKQQRWPLTTLVILPSPRPGVWHGTVHSVSSDTPHFCAQEQQLDIQSPQEDSPPEPSGATTMGRMAVPCTWFFAACAGVSGIWNTLEAPSLQTHSKAWSVMVYSVPYVHSAHSASLSSE